MLVRFENDTFETKDTLAVVAAIYKYTDHTEYVCITDAHQAIPISVKLMI